MKTGTPGLASGIHSGILPGRQKARPQIRAPAFRSDLFWPELFYSEQRSAWHLQTAKAERIRNGNRKQKGKHASSGDE